MKKVLLLTIIVFAFSSVFSQTIIEKSNDVVLVLGRKYYVHTVQNGQTLYSISKVYNAPLDQIIMINKETIGSLKSGDVIRIPVVDDNYVPEPINKISFEEHKVENGESLFGIAQKYNTTQDMLIKYNPQIVNGIKKGMVLKIPVIKNVEIRAKDDFFVYHILKDGENINSIAAIYNVPVQQILQYNKNEDIKPGAILSIPLKSLTEEQKYVLMFNKNFSPDFLNIDPNYFEDPNYTPCSKFVYNKSMVFNVAVMLPFYFGENYSLSIDAVNNPKVAHYFSTSSVFYEFLQGVLLAVNDLKNQGVNINLNIYDTRADSAQTMTILNKFDMKKMDLVIGPAYTKNLQLVKNFCQTNRINFISPFSNKSEVLADNPFVFQFTPSTNEVLKFYAQYWSQYSDTSNFYVVTDNTTEQNQISDTLHYYLSNYVREPKSLNFSNIPYSKFIDSYKKNIDKSKTNYVLVSSTNEVQCSAILNNLNSMVAAYGYKIVVYTLPVFSYFTNLQSDWVANLQVHYATNIKHTDSDVEIKFDSIYKQNFGVIPTNYSYLGYDISYYFISALQRYGRYFQFCINQDPEISSNGIFTNFMFRRYSIHGGFENKSMFLIKYNTDLSTEYLPEPQTPVKSLYNN